MTFISNEIPLTGSERFLPKKAHRVNDTPKSKRIKFHVRLKDGEDTLPEVAAQVKLGQIAPLSVQELLDGPLKISDEVVAKVSTQLNKAGFQVGEFDPFSRLLSVEGDASQVQEHFGAVLGEFAGQDGTVFTRRLGYLSVPRAWDIHENVAGIHGIDQGPKAAPRLVRGRSSAHTTKTWSLNEISAHFGIPKTAQGAGQTIGFVSLGGGINPVTLAKANTTLGLPAAKFTIITVGDATNSPSGTLNDADGENELDAQTIQAVAPLANIIACFGGNTTADFAQTFLAIAKHVLKPKGISCSWGSSEDTTWSSDDRALMDQSLQTCQAMGISTYCAAGDDGSTDGVQASAASGSQTAKKKKTAASHCDYPASSAWNTYACNGVYDDGSTVTAWNDLAQNEGSTGGGVSNVYLQYTAGQLLLKNAGIKLPVNADSGKPGRVNADVAGIASPRTGILIQNPDGSGNEPIGGTSAVGPFYVAAFACVYSAVEASTGQTQPTDQASPSLNMVLYQQAAAGPEANLCTPVTKGNNGAYKCGPKDVFNAVCGLGKVQFGKLIAFLQSQPSSN